MAEAPLMKSGLLSVNDDGDIQIVKRLYRLASLPDDGDLDVCSLLFDEATPGELEWSDFDHVVEERDHIEQILNGALHTGTPGVNILVYGPPGTGKTEFCKTLATRLGTNLYSIGEVDSDGDEPSRKERLQRTPARPVPLSTRPQVDPAIRRDGGPPLGSRSGLDAVLDRAAFPIYKPVVPRCS